MEKNVTIKNMTRLKTLIDNFSELKKKLNTLNVQIWKNLTLNTHRTSLTGFNTLAIN